MKLPISWLKEYIDLRLSPERLAASLTMSGTKVECVESKDGEPVFEIEVTTNRPDCLSILGLAREVAVLTHKKVKSPKVFASRSLGGKTPEIRIMDKIGCPFYTARLIENVSIKPSPEKIQKYLDWMGARPINNAVDATNFVLFETGQPLHAFDYDKIRGGEVVVRRARENEKFLGIDGVEYSLDGKTLVIADAERPIAIAGVIGGRLTEVNESTKNILLESAYFDPALVRQASRRYKISTDSSYRFERGVDRLNVAFGSARARDLIVGWAGGNETGSNFKEAAGRKKAVRITLRMDRIEKLLGRRVEPARVMSILGRLGLEVRASAKGRWSVTPSSARRDILLEVDLIEEILRVEGFEKIPAILPITRHGTRGVGGRAARLLELREFMASIGFSETINYSFLSEKAIRDSMLLSEAVPPPHKVTNALSAELEYFRPSLLPGLLQSVVFNTNRKVTSLKLFEIGDRYLGRTEETVLALCLYGEFEDSWQRKSVGTFFDLKGAIERVLGHLGFKDYVWKENGACPKYAVSGSIFFDGKKAGTVGILSARVLKKWDIPREVIYGEIVLDQILSNARPPAGFNFRVKPVPKFPEVRRDIAFVVDQEISVKALEELIVKTGAPCLKEARLFDQYTGENIIKGKRSLAFALCYQKESGTFTEEEIGALQENIVALLKKEYKAEFR